MQKKWSEEIHPPAERTPVVTVRLSSIIFMDVLPYSMMQLRIRNMQWKVELNCMRTDN